MSIHPTPDLPPGARPLAQGDRQLPIPIFFTWPLQPHRHAHQRQRREQLVAGADLSPLRRNLIARPRSTISRFRGQPSSNRHGARTHSPSARERGSTLDRGVDRFRASGPVASRSALLSDPAALRRQRGRVFGCLFAHGASGPRGHQVRPHPELGASRCCDALLVCAQSGR